jgi:hypothetical protein
MQVFEVDMLFPIRFKPNLFIDVDGGEVGRRPLGGASDLILRRKVVYYPGSSYPPPNYMKFLASPAEPSNGTGWAAQPPTAENVASFATSQQVGSQQLFESQGDLTLLYHKATSIYSMLMEAM